MEVDLFGNKLSIKSHYCSLNGEKTYPIEEPSVNLYIQTKGCNAKCKFCEFKDVACNFNFKKLDKVLSSITDNIKINKISITGGEPTLKLRKLYKIVDVIKKKSSKSFLVMNTNGYNLLDVYKDGFSRYFDSISLSRHHYDDKINDKIFGFKTLSSTYLECTQAAWWQKKDRLHLSCNLIKGYVDSPKEVYKYLEFANNVKINDVGFVSLMKINDYCNNEFIDFSEFDFKEKKNMFKTKEWKFLDSCKCNNFLYIPKSSSGDVVKVYSRCFMKKTDISNTLVFDGENLKFGFNGLTLI